MGRKTRTLVSRSKKALISAPVLKLPDPSLPYEVIADASVNGLGAVLVQQGHAIAYYSQKFTNAEKITTSEQELLAQHDALLQWRCYLKGPQITLVTDHNPLIYLISQPLLSRRQARWLEFFSRFNYKWEYRPGRGNVADPLSRQTLQPLMQLVLAGCAATSSSGSHKLQPLMQPVLAGCAGMHAIRADNTIFDAILRGYSLDESFENPRFLRNFKQSPKGLWITQGEEALVVVPNVHFIR